MLSRCFLGHTPLNIPNGISTGSAIFAQLTAESLYFPQNCPFKRGSGPPSNTWFLGPTRVHNPNIISTSSAVFAGLTIMTDRQTEVK